MKQILIIDDDINVNNLIYEVLSKSGYSVLRAWSGTEALMILERNKPDLILLDLMLPGISGEEVLPQIKNIPVIVLSAKADVKDKINLLSGGAVDYMTKPFDNGELIARIEVQLRRKIETVSGTLNYEEFELDTVSHSLNVNKNEVTLTKTEYALMKLFMTNTGKALAKSVILDRISEDTPDCTEYSLKQHIFNLRKKLHDAGAQDRIEAVWGIGFIFK